MENKPSIEELIKTYEHELVLLRLREEHARLSSSILVSELTRINALTQLSQLQPPKTNGSTTNTEKNKSD